MADRYQDRPFPADDDHHRDDDLHASAKGESDPLAELARLIGQTDRFKAAIMVAGISDWGMLVATGEGATLEAALSGSCGWEGAGPHPHDQVSPISFASKIRTPVLIVNGEDDTNVPVSQAIYFHRALSWYGAEHELVIYPREGHGLVERNHQLDLLRRTRAWFDRWLGDEAPDGLTHQVGGGPAREAAT